MEHSTSSSSRGESATDDEEENVPRDEFTPREYQVELFEAARKENIIVCLGTGTGKTFIAVMLIREYDAAVRVPFEEGGKRTFFLVPTVPLVVQQQKAIKDQTDLRVGGYVGDMNVDNWSAEHWNAEFVQSQVLVMTPDVFRLIIQHGFLALSRVNLLVLDECHRAVKQHTYREIMRCMDVVPQEDRPRILGLTASVLNSKAKEREVERRIRDLEAALSARVLTVSNQQSMARYGTKPKQVLVEHEQQQSLSGGVSVELPKAPRSRGTTSQGQELDRRQASLAGVLLNLGPWCAHLAATVVMDEARHMLDGQDDPTVLREVEASLEWFAEVRSRLKRCIDAATSSPAPPEGEHPLLVLSSAKLCRLLQILGPFQPGGGMRPPHALPLCGIVFVKERLVARVLCDWLHEVAARIPRFGYLKPCFIVGHGGNLQLGSKEAGMSFKKQCKVLRQFCRQEHNLLVATSVVEEGMDVPKCNLVVRFDFPDDFRSYVQSKGRARHQHSLYVMMASRDDYALACTNLHNYLAIEATLMNKCHERRAPLESEVVLSFAVDELLPPYMPVREDGAPRITLTSAIALVNRYCMVLPSDIFTRLKPSYEMSSLLVEGKEMFVCTVYLPMASPLKEPIQGIAMETKKQAKMAAALETCKRLHEIGEFDSSLLPIKAVRRVLEDSDEEDADDAPPGTAKAGTKKRRRVYPKQVCRLFAKARPMTAGRYRLHVLTTTLVRLASDLQNWRQEKLPDPQDYPLWFALLLREDMPSLPKFPIFTRSGDELVCVVKAGEMDLSEEQCSVLQCFHRVIWDDVLRMKNRRLLSFDLDAAPSSVLLAPVVLDSPSAMIDWSLVEAILAGNIVQPVDEGGYKFPEHLFRDAIVVPHYAHPHQPYNTFYVQRVRHDLDVDHVEGKAGTTMREYLSVCHRLTVTNPAQPLLEVSYTEKRMNLLTPRYRNRKGDRFSKKSAAHRRVEFRVPEFCDVHPVPAGLWRKAVCLPSILYRLNQLLVMEEFRASIAQATSVGLTEVASWPDMDFQSDVPQSVCNSLQHGPSGEVEFGGLDPHHAVSREIRMPRLSKSFELQPELRDNPGPSPGLLLEAMTSAKAADSFDLERLEVLGDSFLKLVVTIDLFSGSTSEQEGQLTQMRARIICNRNLLNLGCVLNVGPMLAQEQFEPHRNWLPPGYCAPEGAEETLLDTGFVYWAFKRDPKILVRVTRQELAQLYQEYQADKERPDFVAPAQDTSGPVPICLSTQLPDKSVADSVEAIIGAYLLTTGPLGACRVMKGMGVKLRLCKPSLPWEERGDPGGEEEEGEEPLLLGFPAPRTALLRYVPDPEGELSSPTSPWHGPLELAERTLGYAFRDRSFLLQACTHASYYRNRLTDCYQRLEFLGDAVIDYLVTRYLYEVPRTFRPGQLTDLRSSLVNNSFFAALVVRHGLHRCLLHCNPGLFSAIGRFVQHQARLRPGRHGGAGDGDGDHSGSSSEDEDGSTTDEILNLNANRDKVQDNPAYWRVLQRFYLHEEECQQPEEVEVPKALGDLFESLIGAVFLDCGMALDTVWAILYRLFGREIESFVHRVPLPPIRALFERFPHARFSQAEVLKNDRVKVELTLGEHKFTCVAKSKKTARTALAKKCLRLLKEPAREAGAEGLEAVATVSSPRNL
ncbi:endoribonuclease Dicer-S-like isoform X2 [Haemaphysalis longicornis]